MEYIDSTDPTAYDDLCAVTGMAKEKKQINNQHLHDKYQQDLNIKSTYLCYPYEVEIGKNVLKT